MHQRTTVKHLLPATVNSAPPVLVVLLFLSASLTVAADDYSQVVQPFLKQHCVRCHDDVTNETGFSLQAAAADFTANSSSDLWLRILDQLTFRNMPPEEEEQPSGLEVAQVTEWINKGLLQAGKGDAYRKKLLSPEYGNWVNHEKLFSGEIKTLPYSPSRLWRFSPELFAKKGFGNAKSPYSHVTSERGLRDYAATSVVDQSTVRMMLMVANSFIADRERRGEFKDFVEDLPVLETEELRNVIEREFLRVIGRKPSDDQAEKHLTFLQRNIETGGKLDGLKTTIKAIFLSPESMYRMEFGLG
ncbi:MAG: hypothetical protein OSA92_12785, partial [Pirellulaceae bacterium]|nr:hypothetical protein [Pirellulaceae bacterium]